jgi:hypothetical protein
LHRCAEADGRETEYDIRSSKYWVPVNGTWREVPDDAIITKPNRFGRPRVPISALFGGTDAAEPSQSLLALVSDRRSFRLAHAFAAIKDNTCRVSLVNLVEKIAASVPRSKRRRS